MTPDLRNICIIAHVDHGKTTLVDHLLRQAGTFASHEQVEERVMDTDAQERERGITISAKNASFHLGETKVNIVDTPGHADFSGEVERIMGMVDGALLVVDAAEGPLPQTRFVLKQALLKGLKLILCINKVDRAEVAGGALIDDCVNKVFDLFIELGATEEQCEFPILYACAKDGWCTSSLEGMESCLTGESEGNMKPLFNEIMKLPAPKVQEDEPLRMQVSSIAYSDYLGSLALGRVLSGRIERNQTVIRYGVNETGRPKEERFQATRLLTYHGMQRQEVEALESGDIGLVTGCEVFDIGDTIGVPDIKPLPRISVEEPTVRMLFSINTTPTAGKDGKAIQSRELRERLLREVKGNVALRLEDSEQADTFYMLGRGELQFGILIETLRREGLEFMVGRPTVLFKQDEEGQWLEPLERITLDLPEECAGEVTQLYQQRRGTLQAYETLPGSSEEPRVRLVIEIPTRGLLGTNSLYKTATRGSGLISSELVGYVPNTGPLFHRQTGSLVSDRQGKATAYALSILQDRGILFIEEGADVYEGMIIGESARDDDLNVNPCRPKKLTNVRTQSSDGLTILHGIRRMSLEQCIEWIEDDEWIEVTPRIIRLRKKVLPANRRSVRKEDRLQ